MFEGENRCVPAALTKPGKRSAPTLRDLGLRRFILVLVYLLDKNSQYYFYHKNRRNSSVKP
jgi:hypothetical protein